MNLSKLLFWIFFILGVVFFIWYFVGDSPTLEQGLLLLVFSFLIEMRDSIKDNKHSIESLKNQFDILKDGVNKK